MHLRHLLVGATALALAPPGLVAPPASAAETTCQGKPVTIVASTSVTVGTEGDDVVAMEPGNWRTFDALGGNDTICVTTPLDSPSDGKVDGVIDAGPGDDVVLETPGTADATVTVTLGEGSDIFIGSTSTMEIDAGLGHDRVELALSCADLVVDLADSAQCDDDSPIGLSGIEDFSVSSGLSGSQLTLIGTSASDTLTARADTVNVQAGGGADAIEVSGHVIGVDAGPGADKVLATGLQTASSRTVRIKGGPGKDQITAWGADVVVRGQGGNDQIKLPSTSVGGKRVKRVRQVAFGGPGHDTITGSKLRRGDRLIGGPGRDRIDGSGGKRDFCLGERVRRCERP